MDAFPPEQSPGEKATLQSRVPPQGDGKTLLEYLAGRFRYQSQETWRDLIIAGRVTLNGIKSSPIQPVHRGDRIAYKVTLKEPPVNRDVRILYEEESFLVAEKPGNLPSHADGNFIKNTFIHILTQKLIQKGFQGKVKLVHRLDRETSGLMVVAKQREAHRNLTLQFEVGRVEKEYLAVAQGNIKEDHFAVECAIGRSPTSQISIRHQVLLDGALGARPAKTLFETLQRFETFTLVRCIPKTGRTNQIRVHLDYLGHPILGDRLYGRTDEEFLEYVRTVKGGKPSAPASGGAPRLLLHAHKLAFSHPVTGQRVEFESPIPEDMGRFLGKSKGIV